MKLAAVPGVKVGIRCDGVDLCDFRDKEDRRRRDLHAVRFIEATSGSNFAVTFRADPSRMKAVLEHHVDVKITLDGKITTATLYSLRSNHVSTHECLGIRSSKDGQTALQRFTFGDLATIDESVGHIKPEDVKRLGEIQVDLRWARKISTRNSSRKPVRTDSAEPTPEKALKGRALSNQVLLGEVELSPGVLRHSDVEFPYGKEPFATFIFKYRSRKDLQIEGVIEEDPESVPLEERDTQNMSTDEMEKLIAHYRALQNGIKKEKRDHATFINDGAEDDGEVTVVESRPAKRPRESFDSGVDVEIVDLTSD